MEIEMDGAMLGISHESAASPSAAQTMSGMKGLYRMLAADAYGIRQIRKVMAVIPSPERNSAVLWRCTEGKERCGTGNFLLPFASSHDRIKSRYREAVGDLKSLCRAELSLKKGALRFLYEQGKAQEGSSFSGLWVSRGLAPGFM